MAGQSLRSARPCSAGPRSAKHGVFSRISAGNTRIAAELLGGVPCQLEHLTIQCSLIPVVEVLPQRAETHSLIRYPSPDGRAWTRLVRPPLFFTCDGSVQNRRGFAQHGCTRALSFDPRAGIPLSARINFAQIKQGKTRCEQPKPYLRVFWPLAGWRPVATPSANRHSLGPVRGLGRRLFWTAISPLARLSARPAMWRSVRPTPPNAAKLSRCRPDCGRNKPIQQPTIGAPCSGGLFYVTMALRFAGPGPERRSQICSRRS